MSIMTINPYTLQPRDPRDISYDPEGLLVVDPDAPLIAAAPAASPDDADLPPLPKQVVDNEWEYARELYQMGSHEQAGGEQLHNVFARRIQKRVKDQIEDAAVAALLARLAAPPPERCQGWARFDPSLLLYHLRHDTNYDADVIGAMLAYAQAAPFLGELPDEEILRLWDEQYATYFGQRGKALAFARAVLAAAREKA